MGAVAVSARRLGKEDLFFLVIGAAALRLTSSVRGRGGYLSRRRIVREPGLASRREAKGKSMCSVRAWKTDFPSSQSAET